MVMDHLVTLAVTVLLHLHPVIYMIDMIGGYHRVIGMHPHILHPPAPDLGLLRAGLCQEAATNLIDHRLGKTITDYRSHPLIAIA
jgi:hypothetical protein